MKISNKNIITAVIIVSTMLPIFAYAQTVSDSYTPLAPLPCIKGGGVNCTNGTGPQMSVNVEQYVQYTFNLLIALAAVAAVFMITWGGFEYMTTDAVQGKSDGLSKVKNAVYGLILVLCSFLILQAINPQFVQVPVGLVASLNLCQDNPNLCTNTLGSWATQLENEQAQFDSTQTNLQQGIATILNTNKALQSDALNVATDIYTMTGRSDTTQLCQDYATSPEEVALYYNVDPQQLSQDCTGWQSDQIAIQNNVNAGNILNTEKQFASFAAGATQTADASSTIIALSSAYNTAYTQLQSNGATSDQLQPLTDAYNYADGSVRLTQVGNITNGDLSNTLSTDVRAVDNDFSTIINTDVPAIDDSTAASGQTGASLLQTTSQAMDQFATNYYKANQADFKSNFATAVKNATTPQDKLNVILNMSKLKY